jgi:hypothetical protein
MNQCLHHNTKVYSLYCMGVIIDISDYFERSDITEIKFSCDNIPSKRVQIGAILVVLIKIFGYMPSDTNTPLSSKMLPFCKGMITMVHRTLSNKIGIMGRMIDEYIGYNLLVGCIFFYETTFNPLMNFNHSSAKIISQRWKISFKWKFSIQ